MFNNLLCRFIVSVCVCWCNVAVATGADLLSGFDKAKQDCDHFYCLDSGGELFFPDKEDDTNCDCRCDANKGLQVAFIILFDKHVQMCVDTSLGRFDDDVEWPAKWQKPGNDDCAKYFVRNYLSYKISVKDCKRIIKNYRYKLEYVQDLSLEKVKSCMLSRSQRYDDKLWVGIAECKDGFVGLDLVAPIYNDSGYKCVDKIDAEDNCVKSHGNWNEKNDGTIECYCDIGKGLIPITKDDFWGCKCIENGYEWSEDQQECISQPEVNPPAENNSDQPETSGTDEKIDEGDSPENPEKADPAEQAKTLIDKLDPVYNRISGQKSVWKNKEGDFNTSRLISDGVAAVVLGTAGVVITSNIVKKNQIKYGFEDLKCHIGGQPVAEYGDIFRVSN